MKTRKQKEEIVEKLGSTLKSGISSVFVHFADLSVADETVMRRHLRSENVSYVVAKKTLIRRALENLGHLPAPGTARQAGKHEDVPLKGEVAIATGIGDDVTGAARLVHEFGKKFAGKLSIIGGLFEGRLIGQEEMQEIATIPSMQVLRGMFANVIHSPIQGLVIALNSIAENKSGQQT